MRHESRPMVGPLRPTIPCPGAGKRPDRLARCPVCKTRVAEWAEPRPRLLPAHEVDPLSLSPSDRSPR